MTNSNLTYLSHLAGQTPARLQEIAREHGGDPDNTDGSRGQLINLILTLREAAR